MPQKESSYGEEMNRFCHKVIPQNAKVRLLGVRTKVGNQGLEIHGNEATLIEIEGGKESETCYCTCCYN